MRQILLRLSREKGFTQHDEVVLSSLIFRLTGRELIDVVLEFYPISGQGTPSLPSSSSARLLQEVGAEVVRLKADDRN